MSITSDPRPLEPTCIRLVNFTGPVLTLHSKSWSSNVNSASTVMAFCVQEPAGPLGPGVTAEPARGMRVTGAGALRSVCIEAVATPPEAQENGCATALLRRAAAVDARAAIETGGRVSRRAADRRNLAWKGVSW